MVETVTLASPSYGEYEEKRSRFLCTLLPITNAAEAEKAVEEERKKHYEARHHCWAYLLSDGSKRCSDDGEPQGTAGLPILDALEKSGITDAVAVVTRYFGGVLLGAGGLVHAYSKATGDALSKARRCRLLPCTLLSGDCAYADLESLKRLLASVDAVILSADFHTAVTVTVSVPSEAVVCLQTSLADAFAGRLHLATAGEEKRPVLV